jgi:hypothetical protein
MFLFGYVPGKSAIPCAGKYLPASVSLKARSRAASTRMLSGNFFCGDAKLILPLDLHGGLILIRRGIGI